MRSFDAAVIGVGTMGAFACREMARRGMSVIGFDRFTPPHDRGSHSGETRVFREAYAEHPDYVPLAQRAGELWDEFGREAGRTLLERCGMLSLGDEASPLLRGIAESTSRHSLEVERLTAEEVRVRFPAFRLRDEWMGMFEARAGWIDVNRAIEYAIDEARRYGAEVRLGEAVEGWKPEGSGFAVRTRSGTVGAGQVVVTAGAWAGAVLRDVVLPLRVLRKVLVWIDPVEAELFAPEHFPVFAFADGFFYGFPNLGGRGVKLGIHLDPTARVTDPEVEQDGDEADVEAVLERAAVNLPRLTGEDGRQRVVRVRTCLYTMTPDEHFVIDRHPELEGVWMAAGFSGHGFKFAPAVGEALADLVERGRTDLPVDLFRLERL